MTISTIIAGGIAAIAVLGAATLLLPRHVHIERQAVLSASPQDVLALAAGNEAYQRFNPYKTVDPTLKIKLFGPKLGVGSGFEFDGKDGKGRQTVAAVTDGSVRYDIDLGSMGQPTQMISAVANVDGTLVTWSMNMDLGYNPIFRVFGLFMGAMVGQTFEQGLDNLASVT